MYRPNVSVIVADTFRRDHVGAYGNPYIRTPHLDEFARSAAVFDAHVGSPFPTGRQALRVCASFAVPLSRY